MKKNLVQDVVPPKKSIRNVTLGGRGMSPEKPVSRRREEDEEFTRPVMIKTSPRPEPRMEAPIRVESPVTPPPPRVPQSIPSYSYEYAEPKKSSKKWLAYGALILLVLALAFGISSFFKSATIRVTPKQETVTLNENLRAVKDANDGSLGFQIVSISKEEQKAVAAGSQQEVQRKATGTIIIYNNTIQVQKLVATTRFETPEGLVFRLPVAVSIPAQTSKDGKTVPGSLEVSVEADKAGPAYNVGLKDFTLPGLKGDPKYQLVFAKSKTEMTGGFSGMQKVVAKDTLDKTDVELGETLKQSLAAEISNQIPANFVLYKESLSYKLSPAEQAVSNGSSTTATLKKKGVATAIIFDKASLTKAILGKTSPGVTPDLVTVTNLESLSFSYATSTFNSSVDTNLSFSLRGNANLVYNFDEAKLKTDLLGLSRDKAKSVLAGYTSIQEAWVETHPFWNQGIPGEATKVTIENTLTP